MSRLSVYRLNGQTAGEIELNEAIFGAKVNRLLLDEVVRLYAQNKRTGLASTKTRKQVRGGGRRPWRQKGTGRARHSSIRSPLWRGGGTIFGPWPREIYFDIPLQTRRQALISALSLKNKEKNITVVEDLKLERPKTKSFAQILGALKLGDENTLCVVETKKENLQRAVQNLENLAVKDAHELNAYHVLRHPKFLIERSAVSVLEKRLLGTAQTQEGTPKQPKKSKKKETVASR